MDNPHLIPMRIDGIHVADLTQMLDNNYDKCRRRRRQKRIAARTSIIRIVTTMIVIGIMLALGAW